MSMKKKSALVVTLLGIAIGAIIWLLLPSRHPPFYNELGRRHDEILSQWIRSVPLFDERGGVGNIDYVQNVIAIFEAPPNSERCQYDIRVVDGCLAVYDQIAGSAQRTSLEFASLENKLVIIHPNLEYSIYNISSGAAKTFESNHRNTTIDFDNAIRDLVREYK